MNRKAIQLTEMYRPIGALGSADVLARWRPAYTSHLSGVHRLFINWHIHRYHRYLLTDITIIIINVYK